jgi:exopolysaccharide production protein ExoQ
METLLLAYAGLALLSASWSPTPAFTIVRATQLLIMFALARTLLLTIGPERTFEWILSSVLIYVIVCASVAFLVPSTVIRPDDPGEYNRFSWFAVWPTQVARYVGVAIIGTAASLVFRPRRRWLVLSPWLWFCPLGVLLLMTYSRTAMVACALGVGTLFVVRHLRIWRATTVVALASVIGILAINSDVTIEGLLRLGAGSSNPLVGFVFRGQSAEQISSLSGRIGLWEGVWRLFLERPWFGYGYQGSRALLLALVPWAGHAHNAFAQAVLDLGLVGTLPVVIGLVSCFSPRFLSRQDGRGQLVGWRVMVLVLALFLFVVSSSAETFVEPSYEALMFSLCVLARERIRREARVPKIVPLRVREATAMVGS